jgi:predicted dehydrogenase
MSAPPTRPLRTVLLGTGSWAAVLAHAARGSERFIFVGCWGRTAARLQAFAAAHELQARADLAAIWNDPAVDAVVIALPNAQHREYTEAALRHGKHVFIEKPIAETLADGLAVADLARRSSLQVAVGHCARLLAGNRLLRHAIRSGELGTVTLIEAAFCNRRGMALTPTDWRWHRAGAPGGPLSQIAIHQLDTLRALGGDIESVGAICAKRSPANAEVEDQWIIGVRFIDGALGQVVSSWTAAGRHSVRVTGMRSTMFHEVDQTLWSQPERLHEHSTFYRQPLGAGPAERVLVALPPGNMFRDELECFADAVLNGAPCELSADNACQALAAVDAALRSSQQGGIHVRLDEVVAAAAAADLDNPANAKANTHG